METILTNNKNSEDKIILKDMNFYAYHGVFPEERTEGQNFIVDLEIYLDLSTPGRTDNLEDTINYAEVYNDIKIINEENKFMLIEKLAQNITETILEKYKKVQKVKTLVKKPQAPIDGKFSWVGVEIERTRG